MLTLSLTLQILLYAFALTIAAGFAFEMGKRFGEVSRGGDPPPAPEDPVHLYEKDERR